MGELDLAKVALETCAENMYTYIVHSINWANIMVKITEIVVFLGPFQEENTKRFPGFSWKEKRSLKMFLSGIVRSWTQKGN